MGLNEHDLYARFGTKTDLAMAVVDLERRLANRRVLRKPPGSAVRPHLKALLRDILGEQRSPGGPQGYVIVNLACELSSADPSLREAIAAAHASLARCLEQTILGITVPRAGRGGARRQALFLPGALFGAVLLARIDSDRWELENGVKLLEEYIEAL